MPVIVLAAIGAIGIEIRKLPVAADLHQLATELTDEQIEGFHAALQQHLRHIGTKKISVCPVRRWG